jgi:hypothetical protein
LKWPLSTNQDLNINRMGSRMLRAARLNGDTFRELRDDPKATVQSLLLVAIIGLCYGAGLGSFDFLLSGTSPLSVLSLAVLGFFSSLVLALVWSGITFLIVNKIFRRTIDYWALSRPFFFSWAPGVLFILMSAPVPILFEIVRAVGAAWIAIASVFAVKHATGVSIQQSMLTFIVCILIVVLVLSVLPIG